MGYTLKERFPVQHDLIEDKELDDIQNTKNSIIFYYHLNELFSPTWTTEDFENKWKMVYNNSCYLQPLSGGYSTMSKFVKANRPSDKDKNLLTHFYLELIESALTRVIIVDERISAWSKQILYRRTVNHAFPPEFSRTFFMSMCQRICKRRFFLKTRVTFDLCLLRCLATKLALK